jgi:hypothetical protein
MNFSVTKTLLALGCAGTLAASASAQLPTTYTQGDFLLGFRQVGSNTNSVVVDLGPIASFSASLDFSVNLGSTLSNQYGAGWASDSSVFFSLVSTDSGDNTSYVTSPEYLTGPSAGAAKLWNRLTNTNANIFQGKINNLGDEFTNAGNVQANTDSNAYSNFMPGGIKDAGHATTGNIAWGYFNPTSEGNFGQGTAGVALDTIQLAPGSGKGTDEGTFSISADGNTLTFTPEGAVPEPSSFAAMAVTGLLALAGFQIKKARKSSPNGRLA